MNEGIETGSLTVVGKTGRFPKIALIEPNGHGYIVFALEVDHSPFPFYLTNSAGKRRLLADLKALAAEIGVLEGVREAVVFKALVVPPGEGRYKKSRPDVAQARFDVVVLIETDTPERARGLLSSSAFGALEACGRAGAKRAELIVGHNVRRIGPVDHRRDGVFLFNYFLAESPERNLAVWEYTAGWFADQTGLDNSTVILPDAGHSGGLTLINHCRWDRLGDVLPSLLFKRSFRDYVLANFDANRTAPMPVLYRLA
ncbi:hypothetical protein [Pelagibacterium halotolerans]|uniref:Uncharacterized protein n=1 Tax=Pelagibacterium halotolerans (strain DSM 22347 / JCM 15775 / CGMCC 1.7692 / B2) TaxID=1082931 RepID=G4RFE4_PELHB|nr:hypothetical protein [Pelagibacterium halotolerans]AEQ51982.1 hypothetical protein KKY_1972 [Pelagibacterium halotolerans B2]QJR18231.1 hypothetical protein HKM20_07160 [Pelagibacterium halotolerans]SDZ80903.1 hypothetical protein SAMN05428936_10144 [Pelagibacterium halotolerans]